MKEALTGNRHIGNEIDNTSRELSQQRLFRIRLVGLVALVLCLFSLAWFTTQYKSARFRNAVSDTYQRVLPRENPKHPKALVVHIDQASLDKLGPWPWPRTKLATLTNRLFELKAAAVGFDIIFPEPDRYGAANLQKIYPGISEETRRHLRDLPDPDLAFRAAIGGTNHLVVLGRAGVDDMESASGQKTDNMPIDAEFDGPVPKGLTSYPAGLANIADLDELALGHGLINAQADADGVVRRVPLVALVGGRLTPSFALELIRVGLVSRDTVGKYGAKVDPIGLEVENGGLRAVTLGQFRVPVQSDGSMRLHFAEDVKALSYSAFDILSRPDAELQGVADKLVIVGLSAVGIQDIVTAPTAASILGNDVQSQAVEAILNEGWLIRPAWTPVLEWSLAIALGLAAVFGLPLLAPGVAVVLGLLSAALIVGLSVLAFAEGKLVLDVLIPLIGAGVPATVTMAAIFLETEKRGRELRELVNIENARAAEARRIQFAMLPDPADLRQLHLAVDVWPVLEPAQSIGGDFYDAFLLDSQHFYFAIGDVTGKGGAAALFMAVAKSLSKAVILRQGRELEAAINVLHREIARDNPDEMFVTTLLGVVHLKTGKVELCNAGHENPVILRATGEVEEFKMVGGPPFCTVEGYSYPVETAELKPGDTLIAITDGVSEARNGRGELFGRKRVVDVFQGVDVGQSTQSLVQHLVDEVRDFEAGTVPADDLTIIGVRFNGTAK